MPKLMARGGATCSEPEAEDSKGSRPSPVPQKDKPPTGSRAQKIPTLNQLRQLITEIVTIQLFAAGERTSRMVLDFIRDPPDF